MHRLEKLCFVTFSNEFTSRVVRKFCQLIMNTSDFKFYVVEVRFHVFQSKSDCGKFTRVENSFLNWQHFDLRSKKFDGSFDQKLTDKCQKFDSISWQHLWIWQHFERFFASWGYHQILTVSTQNHATSTRMVSCLSFSTCVAKSALMIISCLYNRRLKQFIFS
jgi:hypothetical protein